LIFKFESFGLTTSAQTGHKIYVNLPLDDFPSYKPPRTSKNLWISAPFFSVIQVPTFQEPNFLLDLHVIRHSLRCRRNAASVAKPVAPKMRPKCALTAAAAPFKRPLYTSWCDGNPIEIPWQK